MSAKIAEVAIPISIALNEQFDYSVPDSLQPSVDVGCRVLVPFRSSVILGYVIKLKRRSSFESKLRPIIKNLDPVPILDKDLLALAYKIHNDYFCSLADAIQVVVPSGLRKIEKSIPLTEGPLIQDIPFFEFTKEELTLLGQKELEKPVILIHDLSNEKRWMVYSALIKKTLNSKRSVIFLVPDHQKINPSLIFLRLNIKPYVISSRIKAQDSLKTWMAIKTADLSFVVGTRSAVFAPVNNLGLIVLEEEEHFAYRQDQVPHYHAAKIAFHKAQKSKAKAVLGSFMPSLDSYVLSKEKTAGYLKFESNRERVPTRIIDMHQEYRFKGREKIISKILEHRIADVLERKEKLLLFINKKGFSTFLYCQKCKKIQACPRCSSSLVYHFKEKVVSCPTCQYKIPTLEICPQCQSSYVKYLGFGLEKVESEILRLFPSVKIFTYNTGKTQTSSYDIMLATQKLLEDPYWGHYSFDTVGVLACEQMLGHVDFRSTEKAFARLMKLLFLTKGEMYLQTQVVENDALNFLSKYDPMGFLKHELSERKELHLPPVTQVATLMVRSKDQKKAYVAARTYYKRLKRILKKPTSEKGRLGQRFFKILEPVASIPLKVRGNYRYLILIKYKKLDPIRKTLRAIIEERRRGIIATFDPSPL